MDEEEVEILTSSTEKDAVAEDPKRLSTEAVENAVTASKSSGIEYSFGTFFNWFMPSCMDLWTTEDNHYGLSSSSSDSHHETIIAYGARSFLFLLDVKQSGNPASSQYSIEYRDLVNVFGHTAPKKFTDVFRSTNAYLTTVVFEKTRDFVGRSAASSAALESHGPRVFVGNSDGSVAVYDLHRRTTIVQDLPFSAFKRPCCRKVPVHSKILSAAWVHFPSASGSVVFYTLDCHLIRWEVDQGRVEVVHHQDKQCGGSEGGLRLFGQLPISCLVAMSAEATADRAEHRLAVGFNGGKLAILSFNVATGSSTALILLTDAAHHDDICSLAFSPYSIGSVAAYRSGLLASVSRDAVLKVWSLGDSTATEIAEYRISSSSSYSGGGSSSGGSATSSSHGSRKGGGTGESKCNWFAAAFLPRSALVQQQQLSSTSNASSSKPPSYEILVTTPTGELATLTLPDRAPSSKLRIVKANKFVSKFASNPKSSDNHHQGGGHQSVVFSIMVGGRGRLAVTYSLDYKLILWELGSRTPRGRFHLFANGALAIDSCLSDRRLAVAFGSSVYALDFGCDGGGAAAVVSTSRLTTAPKSWKFYQVAWNNVSDSERLGSLALGTSSGEVLHYDLNERTFIGKGGSGKNAGSKGGDASKIYKFVWPVRVAAAVGEPPRTAVLSLHASGAILINFVPSRHHPNRPAENFMTDKYVAGLPAIQGGGGGPSEGAPVVVHLLRKHSALDSYDRGRFLVVGNDDGTVDLLKSTEGGRPPETPYQHLFRFRAFTKPIISVEASGDADGALWLAITAMHDNFVHCYRLEVTQEEVENGSSSVEEEEESTTELKTSSSILKVHRQPAKYKLSGHSDRVAATSWSPFSSYSKNEVQQEKLLVTASYDTSCIIWEVLSQQPLRRFTGHRSLIYSIRWSHFRSDLIFSGGEDAFHAWRWPEQAPFEEKNHDHLDSGVRLVKLRDTLKRGEQKMKKDEGKEEEGKESTEDQEMEKTEAISISISSRKSSSSSSKVAEPSTAQVHHLQTAFPPAKALFSLSNQTEYSSSKAEMLEDIAAIVRLKAWADSLEEDQEEEEAVPELLVPEQVLKRILLYSPRLSEVHRFLALERVNHLQSHASRGGGGSAAGLGQTDAAELIAMMTDLRGAIQRAIEEGEADLVLATYASAYSRELYLRCLDCYWKGRACSSSGGGVNNNKGVHSLQQQSLSTRSGRLLLNYGREMEALSRLALFGDFHGAMDCLMQKSPGNNSSGLYREALVLAKVHLASQAEVAGLWERWYRARLEAGQSEGAAKCLVAAGRWSEAQSLLEARRRLCAETSGERVMAAYGQAVELLKKVQEEEQEKKSKEE